MGKQLLPLILCFWWTSSLFAQPQVRGNGVYGLYVRVFSTPGVDPRQQALLEAQRLAFKVFLQQVDGAPKMSFPPALPSDDELSNLVQDVSIENEKITKTQYQATINLTFKPNSWDKWLRKEETSPQGGEESASSSKENKLPLFQDPAPSSFTKKTLNAALHDFQDWLQLQHLLERLPHLESLNVLEFSQTHGKIQVEWQGEENILEEALKAADFSVTPAPDESWDVEKKSAK